MKIPNRDYTLEFRELAVKRAMASPLLQWPRNWIKAQDKKKQVA